MWIASKGGEGGGAGQWTALWIAQSSLSGDAVGRG
jgi:hypothetical protein